MARIDATTLVSETQLSLAVIGLGIVGGRVARQLGSSGRTVLVHDQKAEVGRRLAKVPTIEQVLSPTSLDSSRTPVVVLATGSDQAHWARELLERGHHVVSTSDDVGDTRRLLELDGLARSQQRSLVVGAATSPGLTGLLVSELSHRVDVVDEIHVAIHGTGGPECARQHHSALAGEANGWHDGEWIHRPGGSGRDLLWFPEPIGGKDCYRAAMADPILLHEVFPQAQRISARMSANRRDRFTSRLPMLSPPNAEGGLGGVRVEIRGSYQGQRRTEVAGVAERTGMIAATVAAACAKYVLQNHSSPTDPAYPLNAGVVILGGSTLNNRILVDEVIRSGISIFEYVGAEFMSLQNPHSQQSESQTSKSRT